MRGTTRSGKRAATRAGGHAASTGTRRRATRWALPALALLAALLAGCASDGAARSHADGWREAISAAGTWRLQWRADPWPVPLNEPFDVEVRVSRSAGGDAATGLAVRVDAGMPHHQHGMNVRPVHGRSAPDVVLAEGLVFHMPGAWTLTFDVTDGPITERAEVVVEVR